MGLDLGKLSLKIEADTSGFGRDLAKVETQAQNTAKKLDSTAGSADKASRGFQRLSGSVGGVRGTLSSTSGDAGQLSRNLQDVGANAETAASRLSGLKGVLGVGAFAAAGKKILELGNDYTNSMNIMAAVSGATDTQLAAVSERAKQLGVDVTLPATSASDAALAMSELAKGGFSVEQAMAAAKGTLQLAAAAQVDAAEAATIQSQALQAFGLDANHAAHVADVLAGAANASSADIQGVAYALQASGTVAKQFGLTVDDTATAIAMFANAGIKGSDAGTLLKTSMLALTDQGKPAQAAIEELGLTVYDQEGKFVGLSSLMGQLNKAAQGMTKEQYDAATAVLFGSDAIRFAGIAAEKGSGYFEDLRDKVSRQGQAAEVAEAKTRGLPGAISQVSNALEDVAMKLYDLADGPLSTALVGVAEGIGKISGAAGSIPFAAWAAGTAMLVGKYGGLFNVAERGAGSLNSVTHAISRQYKIAHRNGREISVMGSALEVWARKNHTVAESLGAYQRGSSALNGVISKHQAAARAAAEHAATTTSTLGKVQANSRVFANNVVANLGRVGAAATGVARGGFSLLTSGAKGLLGALGGGWGLAITGVITGLGLLADKHAAAAREEEAHKARIDELTGSLNEQTGAITSATRALQAKEAEEAGWLSTGRQLGLDSGVVVDAMAGNVAAIEEVHAAVDRANHKMLEGSDFWRNYGADIEAAGGSLQTFSAALGGDQSALNKVAEIQDKLNDWEINDAAFSEAWNTFAKGAHEANSAVNELGEGVTNAANMFAESQAAKQQQILELVTQGEVLRSVLNAVGDTITAIPDSKTIILSSAAPAVREELEQLGVQVQQLPDGRVQLNFENGFDVEQLLERLHVKLHELPDGRIDITDNTADVLDKVEQLGLAVRDEKTGKVTIKDDVASVIGNIQRLRQNVAKGAQGTVNIDGRAALSTVNGVVNGLANVRDKSATIRVTHEEYRRTYFQSIGLPANTQGPVPIKRANGGRLPGYADGYRLPTTGAGTDVVDGFLGVDYAGMPIARVDAGEWIINRRSSQKYDRLLRLINQDSLPGFAHGGVPFSAVGIDHHDVGERLGVTGTLGNIAAVSGVLAGLSRLAAQSGKLEQFNQLMNVSVGKLGAVGFATNETVESFNALGQARDAERSALDEINTATEKLAEAQRKAAEGGENAAEDIATAETELAQARAKHTETIARTREAEIKHHLNMMMAPINQLIGLTNMVGDIFGAVADHYEIEIQLEQRRVDKANDAIAVWERHLDIQEQVQKTTEEVARLEREVALDKVRAHERATLAAKGEITSSDSLNTERAENALAEFERQHELSNAQAELDLRQQEAAVSAAKLAAVSDVLANVQEQLNGNRLQELKLAQAEAQAKQLRLQGGAEVASGVLGLLGGLFSLATGNIPGGIAMIGGAIGGISKGANSIHSAKLKDAESDSLRDTLEKIEKNAAGGKTAAALEAQLKLSRLQHRESLLQREKLAAKQREKLGGYTRGSNSGQQRDAQVVMQFGGSVWGGHIDRDEYMNKFKGFGGARESLLNGQGSLRVNGGVAGKVPDGRVIENKVSSPVVKGAAAAVVGAAAQVATTKAVQELVTVARDIQSSLPTGGRRERVNNVVHQVAPLPVTDDFNARVAVALAR